jgi:competence protein ComEA
MEPSLPRPAPPRSPIERVREWVVWFGTGRLLATALSVIAVVIGGAWLLRGSPGRAEDNLPFATRTTSTTTAAGTVVSTPATSPPSSIVVYVTGAVAAPGIYSLPVAARVNDAVISAGGPLPNADLRVVNLAAAAHDGERIYVPIVGEAIPPAIEAAPSADVSVPAVPVDINSATASELDVLPGVGPTTAAAIVAHRQQKGPYQTVDQLGDVRGIGPAKLEALRGLVTV